MKNFTMSQQRNSTDNMPQTAISGQQHSVLPLPADHSHSYHNQSPQQPAHYVPPPRLFGNFAFPNQAYPARHHQAHRNNSWMAVLQSTVSNIRNLDFIGSKNSPAAVSQFQCVPTVTPRTAIQVQKPLTDPHKENGSIINSVVGTNPSSSPMANMDEESSLNAQPRRSERTRTSTTIQVDGYTIKKDNNYVLKGLTYEYGFAKESAPKKPTTKKQPQKPKPDSAPSKPRTVSKAEQDRIKLKNDIETRVKAKQEKRQQFLRTNLRYLEPFLEPKVLERIKAMPLDEDTETGKEGGTMYMQPDGIRGDMRDYQLEGLNFMSKMYARNIGFILGDEMGLGKTLQTISLVCHIKERLGVTGPSLIICPLSVLYSWCNETEKWAPSLKYLRLHNSVAESIDIPDLSEYDLVITTYEMAKMPTLASKLWARQYFNLMVLDEGHRIKNRHAQISHAVRKIHSETRVILTGTPLANDLVEMHALLNFLLPDVLTTEEPFAAAYDLNSNVVDPQKLDKAHALLKLFMIRRLKALVEKSMPKKIETKVLTPLSNTQIWWYKALLLKELSLLTGETKKGAGALQNLIMQLRKCVLHPFLFPFVEDDPDKTTLEELVGNSGKLAVLDQLLRSLYRKGHRVCLFSQFTTVLDILDDYCRLRGWKYCRFDGNTARAERNYTINSFNAPDSDKFLFLMSTKSGGMGLNLQTADTVILYDSDWNPQGDIQAQARVHRLGQTRTVFIYRLVTANTVEERILERAQKKLYLDRIVTRDGAPEALREDDSVDSSQLMAALKFGCNAVFGQNALKQSLPSEEDIEILTDRSRTEDFTGGSIRGGEETNAKDFDVTKEFTATTSFGGIDFLKIREEYKKKRCPTDVGHISDIWKKRQRKNRIKMVEGIGSGYGSKCVPILTTNDYDLESGERSVFQQELDGKGGNYTHRKSKVMKAGVDFENQEDCQVCGKEGYLVCCPRCPVSMHLDCAGIRSAKEFLCCSQHHCCKCGKSSANCGGWLYRCTCCPNSYCEDHLPQGARHLERWEKAEKLGYLIKHGIYVHCSKQCESVAIQDFDWVPPSKKPRDPCPTSLDVSSFFGGEIDDSVDAPDEVMVNSKRRRKEINYRESGSLPSMPSNGVSSTEQENILRRLCVTKESTCSLQQRFLNPQWTAAAKQTTLKGSLQASNDAIEQSPFVKPCNIEPWQETKPAALENEYDTWLPVMPSGLQVRITNVKDEQVVFSGYCRNEDGSLSIAELRGVFRNIGDRFIAINGQSTVGKTIGEVMKMVAEAKRGKIISFRMVDCTRSNI